MVFGIGTDVDFDDGEDVFDYVQIDFILTPKFLTAWKEGGTQGTGFQWIDHETIRVTSTDFAIKNLPLEEEMPHRIFCSVSQKRSFENVYFDFAMLDDKGCTIGGQEFHVVGDSELAAKGPGDEEIAKRSVDSDFELYPNPMSTNATIIGEFTDEITSISVYNLVGERIEIEAIFNGKAGIEIDMSNQESGVYFINLIKEDKVDTVLRFIKL